jgi:hypothetical protein
MSAVVEARIVKLRVQHPGWGPRTLEHRLGVEGFVPVPGRTSIDRALIRHQLITLQARKRKKSDYKRWERSRSMELWQMDIVGGVRLVGGSEAKIVSGIDDHSRFCVSAYVCRVSSLCVAASLSINHPVLLTRAIPRTSRTRRSREIGTFRGLESVENHSRRSLVSSVDTDRARAVAGRCRDCLVSAGLFRA